MMKPLELLQWERRRKLQVREAFRAGMAAFSTSAGDPVAFYRACADYLIPAQRRLIDQDLRLATLIASRVPAAQALRSMFSCTSRSRATWATETPRSRTSFTASSLNSRANRLRCPITHLRFHHDT